MIEELKSGSVAINKELYKSYSENLRKAVSGVLNGDDYDSSYFDLQQKMQANVSRFAAYKAYHATQQIQKQQADGNGEVRTDEAYKQRAEAVYNAFSRYQVAEYNTAVARSRTARQWMEYTSDPVSNELYPNLKWLPSRSAHRREVHEKLYGLVFPKNHPFWKENQPGNLWQCKCDWEETDESAFSGDIPTAPASRGLEGNPGETGVIFTDGATYFQAAKPEVGKDVNKVMFKEQKEWAKKNLKPVSRKELGSDILFSVTGIKEYLNQNHDDYFVKNEMIRSMESLLSKAKYEGYSEYKGRVSHIFSIKLFGKTNYLIANKQDDGIYFYSISESEKVLTEIKKQVP